ncbi:hypothetical protein LTR66_003937 [Elasticomyces elasticus]|nr:hypothetical protein LTR50_004603 [Elasticomyces elasticus]KAK4996473.1 hypothetical protein LTR66_003937 [Elasticomyces elasticus]
MQESDNTHTQIEIDIVGGLRRAGTPSFKITKEPCASAETTPEKHIIFEIDSARPSPSTVTSLGSSPAPSKDGRKEDECKRRSEGNTVPQKREEKPFNIFLLMASCFQCEMKGLTCSFSKRNNEFGKRLTTCTRCLRAKDNEPCLMRRKLRMGEYHYYKDPRHKRLLVRTESDDDERWRRKVLMAEELSIVQAERADKANWVLPRVDELDRRAFVAMWLKP